MTKGKPWDFDEIKRLRQLTNEGKSINEISRDLVKTKEAIRQKMMNLDLKLHTPESPNQEEQQHVVLAEKSCCNSAINSPTQLPSIEETLHILAGALQKSTEQGLDKIEVHRLQIIANLSKTYKEILSDYLDYRGLEKRLIELEGNYAEIVKKTQKPQNT
jgi:hypothetical protein